MRNLCGLLEKQKNTTIQNLSQLTDSVNNLANENKKGKLTRRAYIIRYNKLQKLYKQEQEELEDINNKLEENHTSEILRIQFDKDISNIHGSINSFSEELWFSLIDNITVTKRGVFIVNFKDRSFVSVKLKSQKNSYRNIHHNISEQQMTETYGESQSASYITSTYDTLCKNCGKPIQWNEGRKKKYYCSPKCRLAWKNKHADKETGEAFYQFTCKNCNKIFNTYGKKNRKYCSYDCYIEDRFHKSKNG